MTPGLRCVFLYFVCLPAMNLPPLSLSHIRATHPLSHTCCLALWMSSLLLWTAPPSLIAWQIVYIEPNFIFPPSRHSSSSLFPSLFTSSLLLSFLSIHSSHLSTDDIASFHNYFSPFSPPPPCALYLAASESVLLQQLFQAKLTQTGSLVQTAQGRAGLRGPKAALLLQKVPSASLVTANTVRQQPRRNLDLTKVQYSVHRMLSARLNISHI